MQFHVFTRNFFDFSDPACKPEVVHSRATFNLKLNNIYQCMVTKVLNKNTVKNLQHRKNNELLNYFRAAQFIIIVW